MFIDGRAWVAGEAFAGVTLRTSFPVRGSARTTNVFFEAAGCGDESVPGVFAERAGEAASMMASAVLKQIYTFLFIDMLVAIATILSW
jgi:hypothetical protein